MRNALGKGLAQLLGQQGTELEAQGTDIDITSIRPNPHQPRKDFDEESLRELAESIRIHGLMQPIVVRSVGMDAYEIIAGERRWRAARLAGLTHVPVVIRSADLQQSLQLALIENLQREDISPLECADAYHALVTQHGLTQEEVARVVGKSRSSIANTLRLLKLSSAARTALSEGKITEGHARALLQFDTEAEQNLALQKILENNLSVRQAEGLTLTPKKKTTKKHKAVNQPTNAPVETALSEFFGTPTKLVQGARGGKIEIEYFDDDDLTRILETLGIRL